MVASNWLISAKENNPILRVVLELLYEYWKENDKLLDYYLFHFFFKMAADYYREQWESVPRFPNILPHILQFEMFDAFDEERFRQIRKMSDFHKLTWKHNLESKNLTGTFFERIVMKG